MDSSQTDEILGVPRRPRAGDSVAGTILGGLLGAAISDNWAGAILGAAGGSALANQPQNLEAAVRDYFTKQNLQVVFFNRSPRSIKVTFRSNDDAYWTVESILPDNITLSADDTDDWLYGNLVKKELTKKIRRIRSHHLE